MDLDITLTWSDHDLNFVVTLILISRISAGYGYYFLEDMSPFCGAIDTPILDFWWRLLWVSKPEWVLPYSSLVEAYVLRYILPEIHLWCYTCWPLGGQHGSWAVSSTYLQGIGGTRNWELSCRHSQCEIRQARRSADWAIPVRLPLFPLDMRPHCTGTPTGSDIWCSRLETCSNLFTWGSLHQCWHLAATAGKLAVRILLERFLVLVYDGDM